MGPIAGAPMGKKSRKSLIVRLLLGIFSVKMLSALFLGWALVIPTCESEAVPVTGIEMMKSFPPLFAAPLFGVIVFLVSIFVKKFVIVSLRLFLILLRAFAALSVIFMAHISFEHMGSVQKYRPGFYLFYFSLLGLLGVSVYQLLADRRDFILNLRTAREFKSGRANLRLVGLGTYIIAILTFTGYVALNALFAYGYFRDEIDILPQSFGFMSASASGMLSVVLLIVLTFLLAFFVRRSHRWAGIMVLIFGLFHAFIGGVILLVLSIEIDIMEKVIEAARGFIFAGWEDGDELAAVLTAVLLNPVFYFFIYACIALIFVEKVWKRQKPEIAGGGKASLEGRPVNLSESHS